MEGWGGTFELNLCGDGSRDRGLRLLENGRG
jgi:hypothetical protein